MRILRSPGAVLAGCAVLALAIGFATPAAMRAFGISELRTFQMGFFLTNLAYTLVAAVIAGYVCGRIAGRHEVAHAAAIGLAAIVASFLMMRQQGATQPGAYDMTMAGCAPIAAMVGAALAMMQRIGRGRQTSAARLTTGEASSS